MSGNRMDKVNELIYREISEYLARELELDNYLVTVTHVKVEPDLKKAKVWVSVLPDNRKMQAMRALNKKRRDVQDYLRKYVSMKYIPNISFEFDRTEEEASKVEALINENVPE